MIYVRYKGQQWQVKEMCHGQALTGEVKQKFNGGHVVLLERDNSVSDRDGGNYGIRWVALSDLSDSDNRRLEREILQM